MSKPNYPKLVVQIMLECQDLNYYRVAMTVARQNPGAFVKACKDLGYCNSTDAMPTWVLQIATIGRANKIQGIKQLREVTNCGLLSAKLIVEALSGDVDRGWILDARKILLSGGITNAENFLHRHGHEFSSEVLHDLLLILKQTTQVKPLRESRD